MPGYEPAPLAPHHNIQHPSGERVGDDSRAEIMNDADSDDGDSWRTVDDDDDITDDEDGNHDSDVFREQFGNQRSDGHGSDGAAPALHLPHPADAGLLPNNNALNFAVDAMHGDGNDDDDDSAQGDINNEDEWEIDDWNEGMREGWDWVPLAVVCSQKHTDSHVQL